MKLLRYGTLLGLGLALSSAQTIAPEAPPEAPVPELSADPLGLVQGLGEMERLTEMEQDPAAAKLIGAELLGPGVFTSLRAAWNLELDSWWQPVLDRCESALDALRWNGHTRGERAHVHFALGVIGLAAGEAQEARTEFRMAGARAGQGDLRRDATYNVGTIALLAGEAWRAQMPEFGGTPPAPAGPPVPASPPIQGAPEEEQPKPIEMARGAYLEAKGGFTKRLRMDWQDADTRANMELVMRRLRELDKIEQEREQQEQDQEQQEQDPENQESEDPQEDPEESENSEQQPDESEPPEEPQDPEEPEEPEEPEPQEGEEDEPNEEQAAEPEEQAHQEIFLTKEEVERLLKKLQRHEEQGEELRERRRANRRPTARDW